MDSSFQLPEETIIKKTRTTRQVSYLLWALARRARRTSRHLREHAAALQRTSHTLGACQPRGEPKTW
jgi:hypothetical protein